MFFYLIFLVSLYLKVGWSRCARTDKGVHAAANLIGLKLYVDPFVEPSLEPVVAELSSVCSPTGSLTASTHHEKSIGVSSVIDSNSPAVDPLQSDTSVPPKTIEPPKLQGVAKIVTVAPKLESALTTASEQDKLHALMAKVNLLLPTGRVSITGIQAAQKVSLVCLCQYVRRVIINKHFRHSTQNCLQARGSIFIRSLHLRLCHLKSSTKQRKFATDASCGKSGTNLTLNGSV